MQSSTTSLLPPLPSLPILIDESNDDYIRRSYSFTNTAHWVIPGILMQGGRPTTATQIKKIVRNTNCETFVCLQAECIPEQNSILLHDGGVDDWKYNPLMLPAYGNELIHAMNETYSPSPSPVFLHYGIRDMSTVKSMDGLMCLVSILANRIKAGETIYLHCYGGKGRAGLVAACLLGELYNDLDAESALEYINSLCQLRNMKGQEDGEEDVMSYSSPETQEQKRQVVEFYRRKNTQQLGEIE